MIITMIMLLIITTTNYDTNYDTTDNNNNNTAIIVTMTNTGLGDASRRHGLPPRPARRAAGHR